MATTIEVKKNKTVTDTLSQHSDPKSQTYIPKVIGTSNPQSYVSSVQSSQNHEVTLGVNYGDNSGHTGFRLEGKSNQKEDPRENKISIRKSNIIMSDSSENEFE